MTPHGQKLPASHLALLLDSCANATDGKGSQQFFTRPEFAEAFVKALPPARAIAYGDQRWVVGDLFGCGGGALLDAVQSRLGVACDLYGADIDTRIQRTLGTTQADCTRLIPLLAQVGWEAGLLVANPPFSLRWHADRLDATLRKSGTLRVRETWEQLHPLLKDGATVDSTLATYLLALDRLDTAGEGFLVTLWSTYERLIRDTPAADHLWLTLRIPRGGHLFDPLVGDYDVAVLYFAKQHRRGQPHRIELSGSPGADAVAAALSKVDRDRHRSGISPRPDSLATYRKREWRAAVLEYRARHDPDARPEWNLSLHPSGNGRITTHLTPFQKLRAGSDHLPASAVSTLHALDGQTPMGLTVQRATRQALLDAVHNPLWRVQPALITAVEAAIVAYQAERAPLYPLPPVQRLGYLDEEDAIECRRNGLGPFQAGKRYRIETRTEECSYEAEILDATGATNRVRRTDRELVLEIFPSQAKDDKSKIDPHVFILGGKHEYERASTTPKDRLHTFADLIDHFHIPEVADIATLAPAQYQQHLAQVDRIEALINQSLSA